MITSIFNILYPLAQLFLLWKIWRTLQPIADTEERKRELNADIKKFGAMFAEAAGQAEPKIIKKKVVSFEASAE